MNFLFNRQLQHLRRTRIQQNTSHPLLQFLHELLHERLSYIRRTFNSVLIIGDFDYQPTVPDCFIVRFDQSVKAISEHIPFKESSFDLIISYMDLHHANDIPGILKQINYSLKPDGLFLGAFLGGNSLWQLRSAAQQAELKILGGCSPRVAPMISLHDAASLLQRTHFAIPVLDHETFMLEGKNAIDLLQQLKQLHLTNTLYDGFKGLTGKTFMQELQNTLTSQTNLKLELDILCVSGWAPAENQQKPLARGSAQKSLAEAFERA